MAKTFTINVNLQQEGLGFSGTADMTSTEIISLLNESEKDVIPRIKYHLAVSNGEFDYTADYYSVMDFPGKSYNPDDSSELEFNFFERMFQRPLTIDSEGNIIDLGAIK